MSFFCPHQDGTLEICHRLGGLKCRPGMAGCALFGKVARLADLEEAPKPRRTRSRASKPAKSASPEQDAM